MAKTIRAAVYARISSDQDGSGLGVARQVKECRALADSRGWTVVEEFVDNDFSAYTGRRVRPAYQQLLEAMRARRVDAVTVYHLDRLTRRPKELEEFVEICDAAGIKNLATVAGDVNIGTGDGLLVARIQSAVAANESASKSRRMRSKWRQVAESGRPHPGAKRAYGYEADGMRINRAEAKILRECAERVIAGESMRSVCISLNDRGVPSATGAPWSTTSMRRMLTSPRVIGQREIRGEAVGPAAWKPILTETEQAQIRARLDARKVTNRRTPRSYLLSGMVRCARCNTRMYSSRRRNTRRYVCESGPDHRGCGHMAIVAEPLEDLIVEAVLYRLDTPELAAAMTGTATTPEGDILRADLADDEAQLQELAALYAAKQISAKEWMTARNPIETRIQEARARVAGETNASALIGLAGTGADLRSRWTTLTLGQQVAVVRAIIDHVIIDPGHGGRGFDQSRVRPVWLL